MVIVDGAERFSAPINRCVDHRLESTLYQIEMALEGPLDLANCNQNHCSTLLEQKNETFPLLVTRRNSWDGTQTQAGRKEKKVGV